MKTAGVCALTGKHGTFIRCHIIPEALTETIWKGHPLTQRGQQRNYIRRWTSWYDTALVTQEGENILQALDDWAISFFRRERLLWSSWGPMLALTPSYTEFYSAGLQLGLRKILNVDTKRLRLFYLSVLWRAAACSLWEFKHIQCSNEDLLKLKNMILADDPEPYDFFPLSLIQLCTQTIPFNQTLSCLTKHKPILGADGMPDFDNAVAIQFFRVYFDGLIGNMNIDEQAQHYMGARQTSVSDDPTVSILVIPSERSAHISKINFERGVPVPHQHLPYLFQE